jgi:hypothetical protein
LRVADESPDGAFPYRPAVLEVRNTLARPVAAVSLRADDGGPTLLVPLTVPPGGRGRITLALPATSPRQVYAVTAYAEYANGQAGPLPPPLAAAATEIQWPVEWVAGETIINPEAFEPFAAYKPLWPAWLLQLMAGTFGAMVILVGVSRLIRRPALRGLAMVVLPLATLAALVWIARELVPPLTVSRTMTIVSRAPAGGVLETSVTVVGARRTTEGQSSAAGAWPAYPSRPAMAADRTILRPLEPAFSGGVPITYSLSPTRQMMLISQSPLPTGPGLPPRATLSPTQVPQARDLRVSLATPAAILIRGDQFIALPPLAADARKMIPIEETRPLRHVPAGPSEFGFDADALDLLAWWDRMQRRVDRWYLVYGESQDGAMRLMVTEVDED